MQHPSADLILLLIAVSLGGSAILSLFETAILSSQRHSVARMRAAGRRGAASLLVLLENIDNVLATILLWNNFANVAIASLATLLAVTVLSGSQAALTGTSVATTLVILIFAEITPKAIGVRYPEQVGCIAAIILTPLIRISMPIVVVIRAFVRIVLRGVGAKVETEAIRKVATDELLAMIADQQAVGQVTEKHRGMLLKLISLHELSVDEIMIPRDKIYFLDLQEPDSEIFAKLAQADHSLIPICSGGLDKILGVLRARPAMAQALQGRLDKDALRKLSDEPFYVPETLDPISALGELLENKREMCLVADEHGGLIGMLKITDFMRYLVSSSVGNGSSSASEQEDTWLCSQEEAVRDLNLRYDLALPEDGPRTIGGLITSILDQLPEYPLCLQIGKNYVAIDEIRRNDDEDKEELVIRIWKAEDS